jgi:hypothetical protein
MFGGARSELFLIATFEKKYIAALLHYIVN